MHNSMNIIKNYGIVLFKWVKYKLHESYLQKAILNKECFLSAISFCRCPFSQIQYTHHIHHRLLLRQRQQKKEFKVRDLELTVIKVLFKPQEFETSTVFVSCCCYNKLSQTWWLRPIIISQFWISEVCTGFPWNKIKVSSGLRSF